MQQNELTRTSTLLGDFVLSAYHETRHHTSLGNYGEQYALKLLRDSGYLCEFSAQERFCGDLCTICKQTGELSQIEVKTAYCDHKGKYQFCLRRSYKTNVTYSDYAILICIDAYCNHFIYCIPTSLLFTKMLTISSHPTKYSGKYSAFRVRGLVDFVEIGKVAELW